MTNSDDIDLGGLYSLRKEDDNTWWVWWGGMNMALKVTGSVPCGPGGSIDKSVHDAFDRAARG